MENVCSNNILPARVCDLKAVVRLTWKTEITHRGNQYVYNVKLVFFRKSRKSPTWSKALYLPIHVSLHYTCLPTLYMSPYNIHVLPTLYICLPTLYMLSLIHISFVTHLINSNNHNYINCRCVLKWSRCSLLFAFQSSWVTILYSLCFEEATNWKALFSPQMYRFLCEVLVWPEYKTASHIRRP